MSQIFKEDDRVTVATPYPLHEAFGGHCGIVRKIIKCPGGAPSYAVDFDGQHVSFMGPELRLTSEILEELAQTPLWSASSFAGDYEESMQQVAALTDSGKSEIIALKKVVVELSIDPPSRKIAESQAVAERVKAADIPGVGILSTGMKNGTCLRCDRPGYTLYGSGRCERSDGNGRRCGGAIR